MNRPGESGEPVRWKDHSHGTTQQVPDRVAWAGCPSRDRGPGRSPLRVRGDQVGRPKLGITCPEQLRKWLRQAEIDGGVRPGKTTEEIAEIRALKKEVAELRRANEILKAASAFFAAELDRPNRF